MQRNFFWRYRAIYKISHLPGQVCQVTNIWKLQHYAGSISDVELTRVSGFPAFLQEYLFMEGRRRL